MNNQNLDNAVFIIDGSSFLYRAYYSIGNLTTKEGLSVNAVYGFCRMIKKLIDTYKPDYMVLVWDSKGKTVRHALYDNYKNTRQQAPNDLLEQKKIIQEFADSIGLVQLQMDGIEADDLMYSLSKQLSEEEHLSVLVTSDKDMGQALGKYVRILDPFKDAIITKEILETKLGFDIAKLPFYYALVGDASDNIPGVRGIGPKGAQQLVQEFNSLTHLYENLESIVSPRTRQLLISSKDNAFLSEQLFILRFYETYLTAKSCAFNKLNWDNAKVIFEKLEFKSLLKTIKNIDVEQEKVYPASRYNFIPVTTPEQLNQVCIEIEKYKRMALDTEGTSTRPLDGHMVGLSICVNEGVSYYIPFGHKTQEQQLDRSYVFEKLKPLLEDWTIEKYLHHAKFDKLALFNENIELNGIAFDTIIAASLLVGDGQRIGLKYLSEYYLKEPMLFWADVVKKNKYPDFSYVPISQATEYAAADAHQTMRLYTIFKKEITEQGLGDLFYKIEMPLMLVLYSMEKIGIFLDAQILRDIDTVVSQEVGSVHKEIIDLIGPQYSDINLNSPKQLEELLFTYLQLPAIKKTAGKASYSTDQEVLIQLAKIHPIPALIIRYRELFKLKTTYLEALSTYINTKTLRVHTTFNQTAVATGRLASSEPNLQNIPVEKFSVRSAFQAPGNTLFISADYSQIELRVLAYLSQDQALITAFNNNQDIHMLTAAGLFDIELAKVSYEQRQIGKRINFSILYGLTAHGLAKDLEIQHKVAKVYIEKYMAQYPGVVTWMAKVIEETKEKGYVETYWGRRRYLPGIYEKNRIIYDLAKRVAINTVAQGTAAEIMKLGMIQLHDAINKQNLSAKILLQIHDELLIEVAASEIDQTEILVQDILQNVVSWNVPLIITTRRGRDWQEVTK